MQPAAYGFQISAAVTGNWVISNINGQGASVSQTAAAASTVTATQAAAATAEHVIAGALAGTAATSVQRRCRA